MSKRYVDSNQFTDPWFRRLSPDAKLFWSFLCASCDNSGVWEKDDDFCRFLTGLKSDPNALLKQLGDRVENISENKVLIPKFILFQQGGALSESKPPHRGILKLLEKHNLEMNVDGITMPIVKQRKGKAKAKVKQGVTKPLVTSNSNSKGNGNGKDKEESVRETISELPPDLDDLGFIAVWEEWKDYRKERNFPDYKPQGLKAQFTRLSKWAKEFGMPQVIDSIRASIANNYQGLFEPRTPNRIGTVLPPIDRDYDNAIG